MADGGGALRTMHAVLLALHRRDELAQRPSPRVDLRHPRRRLLVAVFNRAVGARMPVTAARRRRHDAPPPPKRARRVAAPKQVRGARFRSAPPRATLERYRRSNIRLFLVARKRVAHNVALFVVMGVNGSIYHVHIAVQPRCNCPDFVKRAEDGTPSPCKHILFVFIRVLKLEESDHRWFQIRLLPSELEPLLANLPEPHSSVMADQRVVEQYHNATTPPPRRPVEGSCPVCFESLQHADISRAENVVSFCTTCGHNFHQLCFDHFNRTKANSTCPVCHQAVRQSSASSNNAQGTQYMNLMAYSSSHRRELTLAEIYADSHQYIDRGPSQTRDTNTSASRRG